MVLDPVVAGSQWALIKILTGIGFGPALAAIVLDRLRGGAGERPRRSWWIGFGLVFIVVAAINTSSLLSGDAAEPSELAAVAPIGLTPVAIVSSMVAGLTFA